MRKIVIETKNSFAKYFIIMTWFYSWIVAIYFLFRIEVLTRGKNRYV